MMDKKKDLAILMIARIIFILMIASLPALAYASEPQTISWNMLAPPVAAIENPFEKLADDQMDALRKILRLEAQIKRSNDAKARADAKMLRLQLTKAGLDVDALFAARLAIIDKRNAAASGVNEKLVGTSVRLPGYVVPLEFNDQKVVQFLLVPTVGACIHTPPPPANQIVLVRYPAGITIKGLFTPVWIIGKLGAESAVETVNYADGQAPVTIGYSMKPDLVRNF
jgi:uncharacterized protein